MRIQFNGIIEKKSGGCGSCPGGRTTRSKFMTSKWYILPSGIEKTFRVGVVETVSDRDGQFLLQLKYLHDGEEKRVFEVVDG